MVDDQFLRVIYIHVCIFVYRYTCFIDLCMYLYIYIYHFVPRVFPCTVGAQGKYGRNSPGMD